jgi:hypothetical protein
MVVTAMVVRTTSSRRVRRRVTAAATVTAALPLLAAATATGASAGVQTDQPGALEVVASGLNNPRHIAIRDGSVYVAEAGKGGDGPCATGPEGEQCVGRTGSIAKLTDNGVRRVVTGLSSLAGKDGSNAAGPADVAFAGAIPLALVQAAGIDAQGGNPFGAAGGDLGHLVANLGKPAGPKLPGPDFARYEALNNPDKGAGAEPGSGNSAIDSDPYGITPYRDGFAVADAAGNDLLYVDGHGVISTLAVFPTKTLPAPPGAPVPPGTTTITIQPVPTSVRVGPDGALYVSELSIIPGTAQVWRVVPGQDPTVVAKGLTAISDIAFDAAGRLLVLEIAEESIIGPPSPGVLIRVNADGSQDVLARDRLEHPTGLAVSRDGIFVANHGTSAGKGEVLKLDKQG